MQPLTTTISHSQFKYSSLSAVICMAKLFFWCLPYNYCIPRTVDHTFITNVTTNAYKETEESVCAYAPPIKRKMYKEEVGICSSSNSTPPDKGANMFLPSVINKKQYVQIPVLSLNSSRVCQPLLYKGLLRFQGSPRISPQTKG